MVVFQCLDGSMPMPSRVARGTSGFSGICRDALEEERHLSKVVSLDIPFRTHIVEYVVSSRTDPMSVSFTDCLDIVKCRDFFGIDVSPADDTLLNRLYGVSIELCRAAGLNPFHFDQISLFMNLWSTKDDRIVVVPRSMLESIYWTCVQNNVHLEPVVRSFIGDETYDGLVSDGRQLAKTLKVT